MERIAAIKYSIRVFACGLAGLILLLGLAPVFWGLGAWAQEPTAPKEFIAILAASASFIASPAALYSLFCWARVSYRIGLEWNPASAYLRAGAFLATLTLLLVILVSLAFVSMLI